MKLRNKKTGEIGNLVLNINPNRESYTVLSTENGDTICGNLVVGDYDTLAELNEDWEDYEEPKEYFMTEFGDISPLILPNGEPMFSERHINKLKTIGNYFETKEQAEKAVEKLKAWTRLKDKGFKWRYYAIGDGGQFRAYFSIKDGVDIGADLDLLFGGEE
jgi:hypothetical protein